MDNTETRKYYIPVLKQDGDKFTLDIQTIRGPLQLEDLNELKLMSEESKYQYPANLETIVTIVDDYDSDVYQYPLDTLICSLEKELGEVVAV